MALRHRAIICTSSAPTPSRPANGPRRMTPSLDPETRPSRSAPRGGDGHAPPAPGEHRPIPWGDVAPEVGLNPPELKGRPGLPRHSRQSHLRRPCLQMPLPPQSLHRLRSRPCSHMLLPPQSLQRLFCLPWGQRLLPPHSLHRFLCRLCTQIPLPPQSLHRLFLRPCWQRPLPPLCLVKPPCMSSRGDQSSVPGRPRLSFAAPNIGNRGTPSLLLCGCTLVRRVAFNNIRREYM